MIHSVLIAVVDFTSAVRRHNSQSASSGHTKLLVAVVAAIAVFWIALYYWDRRRKQRKHQVDSSDSLFVELCDSHRFGRSERAVLTQAARTNGVEEPALLFVDPALFQRTLKTVATDPGQSQAMAEQMFGKTSATATDGVTTA